MKTEQLTRQLRRVTTKPAEWAIVPGPCQSGSAADVGEARFYSHGEEHRVRVVVRR